MPDLLIIHGPNLNLLGTREPEHYGHDTLEEINERLRSLARNEGMSIEFVQSNSEAVLIDRIHAARPEGVKYIIFNPAAFTHTSIALRDALSAVEIPFIEVHLSNVRSREDFREVSYFSDIAAGVISGLGAQGYELALQYAIEQLSRGNA